MFLLARFFIFYEHESREKEKSTWLRILKELKREKEEFCDKKNEKQFWLRSGEMF